MSGIHATCDVIWAQVVGCRDGGHCLVCGSPAIQTHHLVHRSQALAVRYDSDFGVTLCKYCHEDGPEAPHRSPSRFKEVVLPQLLCDMDGARARKVAAYFGGPKSAAPVRQSRREILGRLKAELAELKDRWFEDSDCLRQGTVIAARAGYQGSARPRGGEQVDTDWMDQEAA